MTLVQEYGSFVEEEWIDWKAINKKTIDVMKYGVAMLVEDHLIWLSVKMLLFQV